MVPLSKSGVVVRQPWVRILSPAPQLRIEGIPEQDVFDS